MFAFQHKYEGKEFRRNRLTLPAKLTISQMNTIDDAALITPGSPSQTEFASAAALWFMSLDRDVQIGVVLSHRQSEGKKDNVHYRLVSWVARNFRDMRWPTESLGMVFGATLTSFSGLAIEDRAEWTRELLRVCVGAGGDKATVTL